jgi:hypothetical protein
VLLASLVLAAGPAGAQDSVELLDGTTIRGKVTAEAEESVSIRTRYGMSLTISLDRVRSVRTAAGERVVNSPDPRVEARTIAKPEATASSGGSSKAEPLKGELRIGDLALEPVVLSLRNGTRVPGYHAFDMDDRHIVYSARLATLRSFLKADVRSMDESSREAVASMRTGFWPDEPPARGHARSYVTERWGPPKRLLVWAKPGTSGRYSEAGNWLENGRPISEMGPAGSVEKVPGAESRGKATGGPETDMLFPASERPYQVKGAAHHQGRSYMARHITVENNASFGHNLSGGFGNSWIMPRARFNGGGCAVLRGSRHTFFVNGPPLAEQAPTTPEKFKALMRSAKGLGRKWVVRKDELDASAELIGSFGSGDETHWLRGVTYLSENSVISIGPRCVQTVGANARLVLRGGAVLGKNSGQLYKDDMSIVGELHAGTREEPITRDCHLGISIKDPNGRLKSARHAERYGAHGLMVAPGAKVKVHTADPANARLVITWHGTDPGGDDGGGGSDLDKLPEVERTINVSFFGETVLNDVLFDWLGPGDLRMEAPSILSKWQRVSFGEHNKAKPEELVARRELTKLDPDEWEKLKRRVKGRGGRGQLEFHGGFPKDAPAVEVVPIRNVYVAGEDTVRVTLKADLPPGAEIRYATDGTRPEPHSTLYTGPIALTEDAAVRARVCKDGERFGPVSETRTYVFKKLETLEPGNPGKTEPGLKVAFYQKASRYTYWSKVKKAPEKTGVVRQIDLGFADGGRAALRFTGFLEAKKEGIYRFEAVTDRRRTEGGNFCELSVGRQEILTEKWFEAPEGDVRQSGVARLKPGKYALSFWAIIEGSSLQLLWEGPGTDKQPIPASELSH